MNVPEAIDLAHTLVSNPNRGDLTRGTLARLDGPGAVREALQVIEVEFLVHPPETLAISIPEARDILRAELRAAGD